MPSNIYFQRALKHTKPSIRLPAKAIAGTMGYFDRLLGISATKMRNQVKTLTSANKLVKNPTLGRLASKTDHLAKNLTSQSNATRIKTGLVIGGGVLANKAMSNYQANQNYQDYNPNYY
jgi:uncharacterized membrane protein YebE (DUF533 family)